MRGRPGRGTRAANDVWVRQPVCANRYIVGVALRDHPL